MKSEDIIKIGPAKLFNAALLEEFFFRHIPATLIGTSWTVGIISCAIFGICHYFNKHDTKKLKVLAVLSSFSLGLVNWWVYINYGLIVIVVLHFLWNYVIFQCVKYLIYLSNKLESKV